MGGRQVRLDRAQLTGLLLKVLGDPVQVGRVTGFVESALLLQNDAGRPVYLFEAREADEGFVSYLSAVLSSVGVCGVLLPAGALEYVAEVDAVSMRDGEPEVEVAPEVPEVPEVSPKLGFWADARLRLRLAFERVRGLLRLR